MGELTFDLQAHRGGAGLWPENSLVAFEGALTLGVTTLELDVQVTLDGVPVIHHDRVLADGEFISWLPQARLALPTLGEAIALLGEHRADTVRLNVETKFDVLHPDEVAPRERFVAAVVEAVRRSGLVDRVSVQSFDWAVLDLVGEAEPALGRNVLTNTAYLAVGEPGPSSWMGGVDVDDFAGDVIAAATGRGYTALSPSHRLVTAEFVERSHAAGLAVIPYTVNDPERMAELVGFRADGLITDRPDLARDVLAAHGVTLPPAYPAAG